MLGKLLKHEFTATVKYMLPLNLLVLASILLAKLFITFRIQNNAHELVIGLMLISFIMILIISMAATFIYFVVRFYRNLFTDEGYLMFTLPVAPWQHIVSKGIVAFLWQCINGLLVFGSIPFLLIGNVITAADWVEVVRAFNIFTTEYYNIYGQTLSIFVVWTVISILVGLVSGWLRVYASIAIGQLMKKHKVIGSVAAYYVIGIVTSLISTIVSIFTSFNSFNSLMIGDSINTIVETTYTSMIFSIVLTIIFSIGYYVTAHYILTKKLNLD